MSQVFFSFSSVLVVEDITRKRAPCPTLEAIYFISATESSIDKLAADFTPGKNLYAAAHVFFTSGSFDFMTL